MQTLCECLKESQKSFVVRVRKCRQLFSLAFISLFFVSLSSFQVEAPDADLQAGRGQVGFILAKAAQGREQAQRVEIS